MLWVEGADRLRLAFRPARRMLDDGDRHGYVACRVLRAEEPLYTWPSLHVRRAAGVPPELVQESIVSPSWTFELVAHAAAAWIVEEPDYVESEPVTELLAAFDRMRAEARAGRRPDANFAVVRRRVGLFSPADDDSGRWDLDLIVKLDALDALRAEGMR